MNLAARTAQWMRVAGITPVVCIAVLNYFCLAPPANSQIASASNCEKSDMRADAIRACAALANVADAESRAGVYTMRGLAWLREEEPEAAAADFTRALELDTAQLAALKGRAKAYALLGKHELAARDWESVIVVNPNRDENYRQRGTSLLAAGKPEEALADFTKAIAINPKSPDGYVGRATVYDHLNRRDKALNEFDLAVGINSGLWTTYLARAEFADRRGDVQMAIENYKLVVKYNSRYWNAYKALHRLGASHSFGSE